MKNESSYQVKYNIKRTSRRFFFIRTELRFLRYTCFIPKLQSFRLFAIYKVYLPLYFSLSNHLLLIRVTFL